MQQYLILPYLAAVVATLLSQELKSRTEQLSLRAVSTVMGRNTCCMFTSSGVVTTTNDLRYLASVYRPQVAVSATIKTLLRPIPSLDRGALASKSRRT